MGFNCYALKEGSGGGCNYVAPSNFIKGGVIDAVEIASENYIMALWNLMNEVV
jgi:hypothetical protein